MTLRWHNPNVQELRHSTAIDVPSGSCRARHDRPPNASGEEPTMGLIHRQLAPEGRIRRPRQIPYDRAALPSDLTAPHRSLGDRRPGWVKARLAPSIAQSVAGSTFTTGPDPATPVTALVGGLPAHQRSAVGAGLGEVSHDGHVSSARERAPGDTAYVVGCR